MFVADFVLSDLECNVLSCYFCLLSFILVFLDSII